MTLWTAESISKAFADRVVLQDISFSISEGEKIGVVGINGTGKSTLLKLIAGLERPDSGQIIQSRGLRIEYLPQQPEFPDQASVIEAVFHGHSPLMQLVRAYEAASADLADCPESDDLQHRLIQLSARMDDAGAWNLDSEAKGVLNRLGITDYRQSVAKLSGGQKKRVALAAALVNPADLLILDEPTNHIDPQTVCWLEQYLSSYRGALLMVTHDRYFLERVTNIMLEIDRSHLYRYEANYEKFLELKAQRLEREQSSEAKRQNVLRRELAWIRRGAKARSTKQQARIDRFNTLNDQESPQDDQTVTLSAASSRLGRKTLVLDRISKSWSDRSVLTDFSYIISRRERLGLIGPNGCGKTTLLRLIAGILEPDSGSRDVGTTVRLGFFSQENEAMDPDLRVMDYIRQTAEWVKTDDGELTAAQMLERFLFPPTLQWTPIRKLSGGEKRRLYLLKILMGAPNVLLLDEPTNDLDITTLAVLEDYLDAFPGAVVVVSHDRYFLDRVVERILAFGPDGQIRQYEGDFDAYQQQVANDLITQQQIDRQSTGDRVRPATLRSAFVSQSADRRAAENHSTDAETNHRRADASQELDTTRSAGRGSDPARLRMKMSEKIELETIDARIAELEQQRSSVLADLEAAASDYLRLQDLTAALESIELDYEAATERWLYLHDLADRIEQQKSR